MGSRTGGGGAPQIKSGGPPPGLEPPINTPAHDQWVFERELQRQIEENRQRRQDKRESQKYPKTEEQAKQRQWDAVKNHGKPLNSNQNAAYTTILNKLKRGEPIDPSDFHKSTFKTLIRNGYISADGKPVMNPSTGKPYFKQPITKKQWQQSQEATYERIFNKPHPRVVKRQRGNTQKAGFTVNKLFLKLKKMQKR